MLGSIWNFVKRHKRKFIFTGAFIGGAVLLGRYARRKLQDFQDKEAEECHAYARRQHHFDSNQRTCNMTVLSMMPNLREALLQALDSESLTAQLKSKPANKVEIWDQLKIMSFTRTVVSIYSSCMLIVMLRVQLNIIGGYMYVDSLLSRNGTTTRQPIATPEIQQKYLEGVHYILGQGLTDLINAVRIAVEEVIGNISLKEKISLEDLLVIVNRIRKRIEFRTQNGYHDAPATSLVCYMMPDDKSLADEACHLSPKETILLKLQKETRDMLESGDFHSVLSMCLDSGFTRLLDKVAEYYRSINADGEHLIVNVNDVQLALAKVIPIINGLVNTTCADAPNQFIQQLLLKEQVKDFAANIYEAFSQPDSQHSII